MSSVGLILGGGGVTGAAYEMATLMAIELATGWDPNEAEVVVGTSAGAFVAALLRNDRLLVDSLVVDGESREDVAARISRRLFSRASGVGLVPWLRHGLIPSLRRPGVTALLGSPAPFNASGIYDWVSHQIGEAAALSWPDRATVITAFDIASKQRVAFGTEDAADVSMADAVAASSAIPVIFRPWTIDGKQYVDGGVVSGTHADLLLGSRDPLDLIIVVAPMAAEEQRERAWVHEKVFDRVGTAALDRELTMIRRAWPETEVIVLEPSPQVLSAMRPNPLDPKGAVPTFIRTLIAMRRRLAQPELWAILSHHLIEKSPSRSS